MHVDHSTPANISNFLKIFLKERGALTDVFIGTFVGKVVRRTFRRVGSSNPFLAPERIFLRSFSFVSYLSESHNLERERERERETEREPPSIAVASVRPPLTMSTVSTTRSLPPAAHNFHGHLWPTSFDIFK